MNPKLKRFLSDTLQSLNPQYYHKLADRRVDSALVYFFVLVITTFLLTAILFIPTVLFLKTDIEQGMLGINTFTIDADFETVEPIMIPTKDPLITLDTTNNKTLDTELLLITNEELYYNIFGEQGKTTIEKYDFSEHRKGAMDAISKFFFFLIPSIATFYILAYTIKYLAIILIAACCAFALTKMRKSKIEFRQILSLSIYTSTVMILIEVLTIPFFISKYLVTYSPFIGFNTSVFAITFYLVLFVSAVRINARME